MNYLVISDIHGGANAANAIPELLKKHSCDSILCCGDILYHGPRNDLPEDYAPKTVITAFNALADSMIAVRGNCEAEVDQMVLNFSCMAETNTLWIGSRKVLMSHGHIYSPDHLPTLPPGSIFLSGHTHIPTAEYKDEIYRCNPGSMTLPKGGHPKTYGVLNEEGFTVYTMDQTVHMQILFSI